MLKLEGFTLDTLTSLGSSPPFVFLDLVTPRRLFDESVFDRLQVVLFGHWLPLIQIEKVMLLWFEKQYSSCGSQKGRRLAILWYIFLTAMSSSLCFPFLEFCFMSQRRLAILMNILEWNMIARGLAAILAVIHASILAGILSRILAGIFARILAGILARILARLIPYCTVLALTVGVGFKFLSYSSELDDSLKELYWIMGVSKVRRVKYHNKKNGNTRFLKGNNSYIRNVFIIYEYSQNAIWNWMFFFLFWCSIWCLLLY